VAATVVGERVRNSSISQVRRVVELLDKHQHDLGEFLTNDRRGQQLPKFLALLSDQLVSEQQSIIGELDALTQNIDHVKTIVSMQQSYASMTGLTELTSLSDLMNDALRLNATSLERHQIAMEQTFEELPEVFCEKQKLLQIIVNLIKNAKDSLKEAMPAQPRLALQVFRYGPESVRLTVADNGVGIAPENLTRIFSHGFTTKVDGHGFGLHHSANSAREMGGSLSVESAGLGHGATFIIELPLRTAASRNTGAS
jgi:C4-dicarboxylate-specific signal transduction histidine kinase